MIYILEKSKIKQTLFLVVLLCSSVALAQTRIPYKSEQYRFEVKFHCQYKIVSTGVVKSVVAECDMLPLTEVITPASRDYKVKTYELFSGFISRITARSEFYKVVFVKKGKNRMHIRFLETGGVTQEGFFIVGSKFVYIVFCGAPTNDFNPKLAQEFIQSFKELK